MEYAILNTQLSRVVDVVLTDVSVVQWSSLGISSLFYLSIYTRPDASFINTPLNWKECQEQQESQKQPAKFTSLPGSLCNKRAEIR